MRLLDRYLLRELIIPLFYCLAGFMIFWISADLISGLDNFQARKLRGGEVALYYLTLLPEFFAFALPIVLLLALLYALSNHARHHELTAMRAAGISLWRVCAPYLAVGALASGLVFALSEWVMPDCADAAERILQRHQENQPASNQWRRNLNFYNTRDNRIWTIQAYNVRTTEMLKPIVEWRLPDGATRQIIAERGLWTGDAWLFQNVRGFLQGAGPGAFQVPFQTNQVSFAELTETPEQIKSEIKVSTLGSLNAAKKGQLSIREIRDYHRLHAQTDPRLRALLATQLQTRLATPWTCLVVVLIAIPFGAASGRRNVFVGVAASIFICFGYYILQRLGLALGTGGYAPAILAA